MRLWPRAGNAGKDAGTSSATQNCAEFIYANEVAFMTPPSPLERQRRRVSERERERREGKQKKSR